ncbi:MAG: hypothetical protein ACR2PZ_08385 [Pseudomonadales bacterium]
MESIKGTVDPHSRNYFSFFESIIHGFESYERILPTSAGDINLTYFRNLAFDHGELHEIDKPVFSRKFSEFRDYESFLVETLQSLGNNISAPSRKSPLTPIASISTGYDSPAVAVVARHAGLKQTLSIVDARGGANDDGSEIARRLGLEPISISRDDWRTVNRSALDVTRFIASDAKGEDVYFAPAANVLIGRVLFTGYRGSSVWRPTKDDRCDLSRTDQSGLSHTEARLHGQYLHIPLPFIGALQENDIRAIGRSCDMAPWRLGGSYDGPICRRIVEQAGVPREFFGQEKKAASVLLFDRSSFLSPAAQESFEGWCQEYRIGRRTSRERLATAGNALLRANGGKIMEFAQQTLKLLPYAQKLPVLGRVAKSARIIEMARFEPEFDHLFPWALAETQKAYR